MQKIISIPDERFTVPPVTTSAQAVISRRWIKFPINTSGTHSHLRNTQLPSTIYTDFGDNENIVDLKNTHLEFDFTGTWIDDIEGSYISPSLTPNFDQNSQALVSRLRIGTSQGMEIEQIQGYNKIANIIGAYSTSVASKEYHLTNESSFSKQVYDNRGQSELCGDSNYAPTATQGPPHNVQKRIILRLLHSSFFNSVGYLPLFLFRNGMRVELDFEDVVRAFVYETNASNSAINGAITIPQFIFGGDTTLAGVSQYRPTFNWFVTEGNMAGDGSANHDHPLVLGADQIEQQAGITFPPTWFTKNTVNVPVNSPFHQIKNFIHLPINFTAQMLSRLPGIVDDLISTAEYMMFGIPVTIYENGELKFRGFIGIPAGTTAVAENYSVATHTPMVSVGTLSTRNGAAPIAALSGLAYANGDVSAIVPGLTRACTYHFFPLYTWDHVYGAAATIPYKMFGQNVPAPGTAPNPDWVNYLENAYLLNATVNIDLENIFAFPTYAGVAGADALNTKTPNHHLKDPRAIDLWAIPVLGRSLIKWNYTTTNIEWRMSLIKPSSDVFTQYTTAFQKDIGIPYPFTRVFQFTRTLSATENGQQQIQIPISVRSLKSCLVVLGDQVFDNYPADSQQRFFIPMLSTFQRRGISRMELVTGGTVKPEYRIQFDPKCGTSHIPLVENFFGLDGMTSFNPSFHRMFLGKTRNLLATGNLGVPIATIFAAWRTNNTTPPQSVTGIEPHAQTVTYTDASRFVWGINLAKKDTQGFASGLDTSMSGSLILNLYFGSETAPVKAGENYDPGSLLQRPVTVWIYCLADALFTAQNDANLVRW
jgi:hypothetical protein